MHQQIDPNDLLLQFFGLFYETTLPAFSKASSNLSAAQQSMGTFFKSPLQSLEIAQVDDLLLSQFMITVHSHMKELKGMVMT